jgi:uncharacterized phage protein (TIGR01671 family)
MREIKFRAWDKKQNRFIPWHTTKLHLGNWCDSPDAFPEIMLLQFTGQKDKKRRDIYVGDIVREFRISRSFPDVRYLVHEIKWDDNMTLDDSYGLTAVGVCMFGGDLEVIGNIYENPELLSDSPGSSSNP